VFALSCEALPDDGAEAASGYALQPSTRFAHALAYVTDTARAAGFAVIATERAVLRQDHGCDVNGYLVVLS
jgi:predicted TPR repeat methyltransferase